MRTADQAALMDRIYRRQRHIYDATRKFYLLGRDPLIAGLKPPDGAAVLEVACGTGRNLIAMARAWPTADLYGFDISRAMLSTAQANVERAGLSERIRLAEGDAARFDPVPVFARAQFERVVISYALSMIPSWAAAAAHALDLLTPDGELHVVDFGDQAGWPGPARALLRRWLAAFEVSPRDELGSTLQTLSAARRRETRVTSCYARYATLAVVAPAA